LKTILTLEVEYDPSITDPEGLATAMDRLLETACSTPGILGEYGNPKLDEFLVAVPDPCGPATVVLNVSGGVVQDAFCSPASTRVVLVDWDTEGQDATSEGVYQIEAPSGRSYYAFVTQLPATPLDQLAGWDVDRALLAAGIDVEAGPAALRDSDFIAMCRRVAETADNWADCSDMKEALAVFKELGRDCRTLLEAAGAQTDAESDIPARQATPAEQAGMPAMRTVEYWRMWRQGSDCGTWDTDFIEIPADTPEDQASRAIEAACERVEWRDEPPQFVGLYAYADDMDEDNKEQPIQASSHMIHETKRESVRYVLYDLDTDSLASTTIYDDHREAVDDADHVNDVIVLPISLTPRHQCKENSQ